MKKIDLITLIEKSLITEAELTPKPGLVDKNNNGSHNDMDLSLFKTSTQAIKAPIAECYGAGIATAFDLPQVTLCFVRPIGIMCEKKMFSATSGVNTHKGAIFALGLLSAAIGRLTGLQQKIDVAAVCQTVAQMSKGMTEDELAGVNPKTAGERFYQQYGFSGARGMAESGFSLIIQKILPFYIQHQFFHQERALLLTLLHLMALNNDTNLLARGGIDGLKFVQRTAKSLVAKIENGSMTLSDIKVLLLDFDLQLIDKNLSPGGSADLLAVTYFLSNLPPYLVSSIYST